MTLIWMVDVCKKDILIKYDFAYKKSYLHIFLVFCCFFLDFYGRFMGVLWVFFFVDVLSGFQIFYGCFIGVFVVLI